jgi:hypothetical protein
MAELVGPKTWRIQGRRITLPVTVTDAEMLAAVFRADPERAASTVARPGLRSWTLAGHAFSVLMLVRYGEWALGSYDEVGVGLFTRGPGGRVGLHVVDLPVTGAFTCEAGQDFWGLPKWMMRSELNFVGRTASGAVYDGDTLVLRVRLEAGRVPVPLPVSVRLRSWSGVDQGAQAGVLLRGAIPMTIKGTHLGRGTARVELSDHPMARRMAALGMTRKPLFTLHAARLSGELDAFETIG